MEGIILSGIGGFYTVREESGACYTLRAQAKLRRQKLTPLVGDRVSFQPGEKGQNGWLEAILPRRNQLVRPPVANIDLICVVVAAGTPIPDLLLVDRMLMYAQKRSIGTALVVNKADEDGRMADEIARQYSRCGAAVFRTCAMTGEGVDELRSSLRGKVHALGGQSGVGKSSLVNRLYGFDRETGSLSERIDRGKNTTRRCELIPLPDGGMVLDTPGFSLLEMELCDPFELRFLVPEFAACEGKCRFSPCAHVSEPECAIRGMVERGEIPRERWERYCTLFNDMKVRWRERYG